MYQWNGFLTSELAAQPTLRGQGAVRAMLEELAEAALFEAWMGPGGQEAGGRVILLRGSEALLGEHLTPGEYLGAVCGNSSVSGRFAVRTMFASR